MELTTSHKTLKIQVGLFTKRLLKASDFQKDTNPP